MSELKPVTSSNIKAAGYSENSRTLVVEFKSGKRYRYANISPELWKQFEATFDGSQSAGKFFNANIRPLPCEPIED
ncbi:MAG: KTSC domain-containing protein [Acidobacteria bacterium]|nr:KTSC domain-containing protein [Acidobacteriota bacterium]